MQKLWTPDDGYADIVVGLQFGDEAKARIVDMLAELYDIVVRYNGGANAGHTVVTNGREFLLRQVPSAVAYPGKQLYIASECMVSVGMLDEEIEKLETAGVNVRNRLRLSGLTSVVQPHHVLLDRATAGGVGTTGQGMGYCRRDKAMRVEDGRIVDIRLSDLVHNFDFFFEQMQKSWEAALQKLNMNPDEAKAKYKIDIGAEWEKLKRGIDKLRNNNSVDVDPFYLMEQIRSGMKVLFEGAQSLGLDTTIGTRPYTTVSNITPAAAVNSAGIDTEFLRHKYGVLKLIPSRVGKGPFVGEWGGLRSEQYWNEGDGYGHSRDEEHRKYGTTLEELLPRLASDDDFDVGMALRILGGEYGASGRPRRVGKLDLALLRTYIQGLGIDKVFATKADQLRYFSKTQRGKIPVITDYKLDGKALGKAPFQTDLLRRVEPVIREVDGFDEDISGARAPEDLNRQVHAMIDVVQEETGARVLGVGVGKGREQYVELQKA